ncbi:unnamed protein product [Pleuronectes platessa]|uniref:Uncharacterized protein n=1 Tax=Pleuronectes platessa TaxID=8262 RepID=A0A9N7U6J8_PLEPL|nr:unnamed protein product [Pleuronectes platessa]
MGLPGAPHMESSLEASHFPESFQAPGPPTLSSFLIPLRALTCMTGTGEKKETAERKLTGYGLWWRERERRLRVGSPGIGGVVPQSPLTLSGMMTCISPTEQQHQGDIYLHECSKWREWTSTCFILHCHKLGCWEDVRLPRAFSPVAFLFLIIASCSSSKAALQHERALLTSPWLKHCVHNKRIYIYRMEVGGRGKAIKEKA